MNEKHCIDLLAGHALEILDGEDRLTAEEHLVLCTECREEAEQLREVLHFSLGQAAPIAAPSSEIRTQFLARLALEISPALDRMGAGSAQLQPHPTTLTAVAPLEAPLTAGFPSRQRVLWLLCGATLPAAAAVLFCVLFLRAQNQLDTQKNNALANAIKTPHTTMQLNGIAVSAGMRGEMLMQNNGNTGVLIVFGMRQVPSGMVYTCWVRRHGQWIASGALQPDASGMAMIPFMGTTNLSGADTVAITMERSASPSAPSAPMLLTSSI